MSLRMPKHSLAAANTFLQIACGRLNLAVLGTWLCLIGMFIWAPAAWATNCNFTVQASYCSNENVTMPFTAETGSNYDNFPNSFNARIGDSSENQQYESINYISSSGASNNGSTAAGTLNWNQLPIGNYTFWAFDAGDQCWPTGINNIGNGNQAPQGSQSFVVVDCSVSIDPPPALNCPAGSYEWKQQEIWDMPGNVIDPVGNALVDAGVVEHWWRNNTGFTYAVADSTGNRTISIPQAISWDGYQARPSNPDADEQFRIEFYRNNALVACSNFTNPLAQGVKTASSSGALTLRTGSCDSGSLQNQVNLADGFDQIKLTNILSTSYKSGTAGARASVAPAGFCIQGAAPATTGNLAITKQVTGGSSAATFTLNLNCSDHNYDNADIQLTSGQQHIVNNIPTGTTCSVTETNKPAAPTGFNWGAEIISSSVVIAAGSTSNITVTNPLQFDQLTECYAVADKNNGTNKEGRAFSYRSDTNTWTNVGNTGVNRIEAIAFDPVSGVLYTADHTRFGQLNVATGGYSLLEDSLDDLSGPLGSYEINDIDGLSVDPHTGIIWASDRIGDEDPVNGVNVTTNNDIIFQINPVTNQVVHNAFGPGIDYVVAEAVYDTVQEVNVYDIDDLAIDPVDGALFAISNQDANGGMLTKINKADGSVLEVVGNFALNGSPINDMEGLGFYNDGSMFGTTGSSHSNLLNYRNQLFFIDKETAALTHLAPIDPTEFYTDIEAVDCLRGQSNLISGTVYVDADQNQVKDGSEAGLSGITVELYRDTDSSGTVNSGDTLLHTIDTNAVGFYDFGIAAIGKFALQIDTSDLPAQHQMSTDNLEVVNFISVGETDIGNDFGVYDASPSCSISAFPASITSGQSSSLSWTSNNASSASLSSFGGVAVNGTQSVSPASTQTYTLTVTGAGGTASCSTNVVVAATEPLCYAVADEGDQFFTYDAASSTWLNVGDVGSGIDDIEAIAYDSANSILYAANNADFGVIDVSTGLFSLLNSSLSNIDGELGTYSIQDIDGLAVDPFTGLIWASDKRRFGTNNDVIFKIDPATNDVVFDAFGVGIDYVLAEEVLDPALGSNVYVYDIDDLAVDPETGNLYVIANNDGRGGVLTILNKIDGSVQQVIGNFAGVEDMEGLGFYNSGQMYGTTGDEENNGNTSNRDQLFLIDKNDASLVQQAPIDPSGTNKDIEAVDCLTGAPNRISGSVFHDTNSNQSFDGSESGTANVEVELYRDVNANSVLDAADILLFSQQTDAAGAYSFLPLATGRFVLQVNTASLPSGHALTTDNIEAANFTDVGQQDQGNDFGHNQSLLNGSILITHNTSPASGQDFGYTASGLTPGSFSLDNDSNATLNNQQLFSNLSAGNYRIGATTATGWVFSGLSCDGAGSSWSRDGEAVDITLATNQALSCQFNYVQPSNCSGADEFPNVMQAFTSSTETRLDDNTASACFEVSSSLSIRKVLQNAPASMNGEIYRFDIICDGSNYVLNVAAGSTETLANIAPGSSCTVTESAAKPTLPAGYSYDTETYSPAQTFTTGTGNTLVTVTNPVLNVDLSILKQASKPGVSSGETLVYILTVTNEGSADAQGVFVNDTLPSDVEYISDNAPVSSTTYSGNVWTIGNLAAGASIALEITVRLK